MLKVDLVIQFDSKAKFMKYVDLYNSKYRVNTEDKRLYIKLIDQFRQTRKYKNLFKDDSYIDLAYRTLEAWNMNQRGTRLASIQSFTNSIIKNTDQLSNLSKYRLENLKQKEFTHVFSELWSLFNNIEVMATKARIVGLSKTLHFLLPDLVMPIDRRNILLWLYQTDRYSKEPKREFSDFKEILLAYARLSKHLQLSINDVDNVGWNKSIPKLIDNAIIGNLLEITSK